MLKEKEIICHGVTYKTLSAFCRTKNIAYATCHRMLKNGMTPEEILRISAEKQGQVIYKKDNEVSIYQNSFALCSDLGIDHAIYTRYAIGHYSVEKLVELCLCHGVTKLSSKALCALFDISHSRYRQLLKDNIPKDTALDICLVMRHEGVHAGTEICAILNISYDKYSRLIREGISADEAIVACLIKKTSCGYLHNGNQYKTKKDLCKAEGISYERFIKKSKTMSIEAAVEACRAPSNQRWASRKKPIVVQGVYYESQRQYCRAVGITIGDFQRFVKSGKIVMMPAAHEE